MAFRLTKVLGLEPGGLFGGKKRDLGPIMKAPLPPKLTDFPVGQDVNEAIRRAISEGFGGQFESRATSPVVAQREARFKEQELPFIGSQMSGRGLGRSTIAGQETGRAFAQKERDINQTIADAYLQNVQAKERARGQGLQFAAGEAGQGTLAARELSRRAGIDVGAQQAESLQSQQDLNRLIASISGFDLVKDVIRGAAGGGTGEAQPGGQDMSALLDFFKKSQGSPFVAT